MTTISTYIAPLLCVACIMASAALDRTQLTARIVKLLYLLLAVWALFVSFSVFQGRVPTNVYVFGVVDFLFSCVMFFLVRGGGIYTTIVEVAVILNVLGSVALLYTIS